MKNRFNSRRDHRTSILPFGRINLKSGANELFNIYETWGKDTGQVAEVWKTYDGSSYVLIFSAGSFNREPGETRDFRHDQTGRPLFGDACLVFVKELKLEELKNETEFGKSLRGYVYK